MGVVFVKGIFKYLVKYFEVIIYFSDFLYYKVLEILWVLEWFLSIKEDKLLIEEIIFVINGILSIIWVLLESIIDDYERLVFEVFEEIVLLKKLVERKNG